MDHLKRTSLGAFLSLAMAAGAMFAPSVQAQTQFGTCQQAVEGQTWAQGSKCLSTPNFTLVAINSVDVPLYIDHLDANSISMSADVNVFSSSYKPFGPDLYLFPETGFKAVASSQTVIGTRQTYNFDYGQTPVSSTEAYSPTYPVPDQGVPVTYKNPSGMPLLYGAASQGRFIAYGESHYMTAPDPAGNGLTIVAVNNGASTSFSKILYSVTVAVPEPSTWALMALGLLGVAANVRRQRR